ncbi:GAF domain-containing protein [uncultured Cellulomonas sp.]|uniref:GAF domain-containing sensor histidine kinase n=1 Tax=uncultured Cellulomonas sp. TaxID=189682 RepID=UPI0028E31A1C|nr:GAF domain-containing protein [uncultured Cellulomonas sp.]
MSIDETSTPAPAPSDSEVALLDAILGLAADLDIQSLLERFVVASTELTGARYGAINIVDESGASTTFVQSGVDPTTATFLGHPPHAWGVLGSIPDEGVLRLEDLTAHPAFRGLPAGHPPMGSFLGAAVRVGGARYGTLYLSEKAGGFHDQDQSVALALAAAAAVAVQNAQLYALERRRQQWLTAAQVISNMLLEDADDEDVLVRIAASAREIDQADAAALVLPGRRGELVLEIVSGVGQDELLGLDLTDDERVRSAFDDGTAQFVSRIQSADPSLTRYGPALFAPLRAAGQGVGVLLLLRRAGAEPFTDSDLTLSQAFASQAALAFVLAEARRVQGRAVLDDERTRIARDLHDLAIQQLFAAGMQLESARTSPDEPLTPSLAHTLDTALSYVDAGIQQIRVVVRTLDDPGAARPLVERVTAEVDLASSSLGFPPSLLVSVDGDPVTDGDPSSPAPGLLDDLVAPGRANNVVAVVREALSNTARHAHSQSVAVRLMVSSQPPGLIVVEVEDDGVGVPAAPTRASGTKNLAIRARQSGGTFSLQRPPSGRGALLRWTAPLD